MKFEINDWVQANTDNGELIHGFIEVINTAQSIARIYVVKSDNESSVGKPMVIQMKQMKKLAEPAFDTSEEIESLIDLALATWDEQWFNELTGKLLLVQSNEDKKGNHSHIKPSSTSRISFLFNLNE